MKKKYTIGLMALFAIALLGVGMVSAFGIGQGKALDLSEEEQTAMQEFQTAVHDAIESGNYDSWKTLMESKINEDEFAKAQERQTEMKQHKVEMQEAFESGEMPRGQGYGMHGKMKDVGNFGECPFADAE